MAREDLQTQTGSEARALRTEDDSPMFSPLEFVRSVWAKRYIVVAAVVLGFVVFFIVGKLTKRRYTADVSMMPPDASSLSTTSMLSALSGAGVGGGLGSGLFNTRTPGATVIGILTSRTVQDRIIDQFHLMSYYRTTLRLGARGGLSAATGFNEDKRTGLLTIAVTTTDPKLSRDLASAYVVQLDSELNEISTSSAHRERVFLEERLASMKGEIDTLAQQLSRFSSSTGTLNPQLQGQALLDASTRLQLEIGSAQAELASLRSTYSDENVRVRSAQARVNTLSGELAALRGRASENPDQPSNGSNALPGLRQLPKLGVTYANLNEQLLAEQAVYATLKRQYELARVQEAKELPSAKVISPAETPEVPSSPGSLKYGIYGAMSFGGLALAAVCIWTLWQLATRAGVFDTAGQTDARGERVAEIAG